MDRRSVLKITGTLSAAAAAAMAFPRMVFAAYNQKAFKNPKVEDSLNELFGGNATTPSGDIKLKAPDIAENGAVVPIEISTSMKADKIAFMVKENRTRSLSWPIYPLVPSRWLRPGSVWVRLPK